MPVTSSIRSASALVMLAIVQQWNGATLHAQAWVPTKGEGTVSVTYQNYDVAGHYDAQGHKKNNGGTYSHVAVAELDYGITDSIGLTVQVPFVISRYTGPPVYFVGGIETHPGPLDDGAYHGAFQDLRAEVRRLFWVGPIPVAPFIAASVPTHDYETVGEAVPGRHRRDLQIGANIDTNLDRLLSGMYAHGRYGYGRAQEIEGFAFTRSNIDVEVGFPVASRILLRGVAGWQIRHKGPSVRELTVDWEHHDRFIAPSYTNLGIGTSVLVRGLDVYGLWLGTAKGSNGAHRARTIVVGVTVGFGSGLGELGGTSPPLREVSGPSRGRFGGS